VVEITLNNLTNAVANWSIEGSSQLVTGDQAAVSFGRVSLDFAPEYTVCFWTDATNKECATLSPSQIANYTGSQVIATGPV